MRDSKVLIKLNDENLAFHNIYELDLLSNRLHMIFHNLRFPAKVFLDNNITIRMVVEETHDGSLIYYRFVAEVLKFDIG